MKFLCSLFLFFFFGQLFAQFPGCPAVDAGINQTLPCTQSCTNLTAIPFQTGATTSYGVASIPHNPPIAYNQVGGTPVSVGTDDIFSPVITLPFAFCYYGQTYTTLSVGSNSTLKFGSASGGMYNPYAFTASVPSAALSSAGDVFGPYHDIDPSIAGNVNYYILGSAPCRIFVVSFDVLAHFSCTTLRSTHMMVLYETTNVIDIYIENKATCASWNGGRAIVGIQNPAGTQGIAAPARNTAPTWTVTTPEAWRFSPNGTPTYTIEWLEAGSVIGISENITVCPSDTTTYVARATYTRCDGTQIIEVDSVTITPSPLSPLVTPVSVTPASCGASDGALEVIGSGGAGGYTYSINNGVTYQASPIFSGLPSGTYTVLAQDVNGCTGPVQIDILNNSTLALVVDSLFNPSCSGGATGSIHISGSGGTSPYTFSLNMGTPQASGSFNALAAATYNMTVFDNVGCTVSQFVTLNVPTPVSASENFNSPAGCSGNNGYVVLTVTGGSGTYTYSLDGGTTNFPLDTVGGLAAGTYSILVSDNSGCSTSISVTIGSSSSISASISSQTSDYCGFSTGTATISASGGSGIYTYSTNGGTTSQTSNVLDSLAAGSYSVFVSDDLGCSITIPLTISPSNMTASVFNQTPDNCNTGNGTVTISASNGSGSYTYSINGGTTNQASNVFDTLFGGSYTVIVTDSLGCTFSVPVTITATILTAVETSNIQPTCNGGSNGQVQVNGSGTPPPYAFQLNGGTPQASGTFPGLAAGTYVFTVTDQNLCTDNITIVVTQPTAVNVITNNSIAICNGQSGNLVSSATGGTGAFTFSWNNGVGAGQNQLVSPTTNTTYIVTATDANGCTDTGQVVINVNPLPIIGAGANQTVCLGSLVTLSGSGGISYTWNNGITNSTAFSPSLGSTSYTVTGTDANGCMNTDSVLVTVVEVPVAEINALSAITGYPGLTVTFSNTSQFSNSYVYSYGNGSNLTTSSLTQNGSATYSTPGTYSVILTASNGLCQDTAMLQVIVIPFEPLVVVIPNVFTPDGDGTNDEFYLKLENAVTLQMTIVNRWGNVMAEINDLTEHWKGDTKNGNEASDGVYFVTYVVTGKDGTTQKGQGFVELLRN